MYNFFKRRRKRSSGNLMASLSKLSKAFMLPISLLPVAGLMLGIGSTLLSQSTENTTFWQLGRILKMVGNIAFINLPALFAISIAIAYTKNSGAAGLTAFVGWMAYNAFIAAFMQNGHTVLNVHSSFSINAVPGSYFTKLDRGSTFMNLSNTTFDDYIFQMDDNGYIPPYSTDRTHWSGMSPATTGMKEILVSDIYAKFGTEVPINYIDNFRATSIVRETLDYNLLFWNGGLAVDKSAVTPILGIGIDLTGQNRMGGSLNTGVFGGIIIGALVAKLYNTYHNIALPRVISFFSGVRFVPIITFVWIIPLALATIFIWPGLGILLNNFGKWTGTLPLGLDSFVFGLAKRSLLPFGLHHVFYAPLWWTGAGGRLSDFVSAMDVKDATTLTAQGDQSIMMAIIADGKLKIQDVWSAGLHVGRFQSGEFAMMMFALPALAVAMWMAIPKDNRRAAMGIYWSAAITSFLTGITEPLEFTFLFVVPLVYYLIHVPIFASSYMLANITGIKVGMTFSGGMFDWIIFGIIPIGAGHLTNFWLVPIEGLGYSVLEFVVFYFLLKKYKWAIPGMRDGIKLKLYTKSDLRDRKQHPAKVPERILGIIDALGGLDNIDDVDACATRLRVKVKDAAAVDSQLLKSLGATAVIIKGLSTQSIFGGEADNIKSQILNYQDQVANDKTIEQKDDQRRVPTWN